MKFLIMLFFIFTIPMIMAVGLDEAQLSLKVSNNTIQIIDTQFPNINNRNFSYSVVNNSVIFTETNFTLIYEINESATSFDFAEEYSDCLGEKTECEILKRDFDRGWNSCLHDIDELTGENGTDYKDELANCNLKIREKDLDLNSKQAEIKDLKDEEAGSQNSKWFWGIGGVIIGGVAILFKEGKIGGKVKERAVEEFNPQQAG